MPDGILRPRVTYPGTLFGGRMRSFADRLDPVAAYVAETFLTSGHSAFISDGVSTFGVGLHVLAKPRSILIHTNNLALAHEYAFWRGGGRDEDRADWRDADVDVVVPQGSVDPHLLMVFGPDANRFANSSAEELEFSVISVTALFGARGPAGKEHHSMSIKRAAVARARRIVWVADWHKLSCTYAQQPLVHWNAEEWRDAVKKKDVWVVTTHHPDSDPKKRRNERPARDQDAGLAAYNSNASALSDLLHEGHFVELPPPPEPRPRE